jgi:serine/threonine-protein kinase
MLLERIGPYRIVGRLGKGGMGTVYKAVNAETNEPAAVKLLSAEMAEEEGFRDRFEAEIETLRKLNHPNIVRLFGFGEQDGHLFYAMELVFGNSLEEELGKGRRFDWREVVRLAADICKALRHAHDRGIIHRDIKPGNLLLANDGQVKIADFGIARFFGHTKMTVAGSIIGTAEYMAPEQAAGKPVEPRSDLYSLGAVMYVLLARRPVFKGKSLADLVHKQQYEIPESLRRYNADVPGELEHLIAQLLEKDPERRLPNAMILARYLEAMLQALPQLGATVQADADYLSPDAEEKKADASRDKPAKAGGDSTNDCAATSNFTPTPPPEQEIYVEPSSNPLAPTIASTGIPILDAEPEPPPESKPVSRFVVVSEDDLDRAEDEEPHTPWISLNTLALIAALLMIGGGMWYFLQPPSADSLYNRIEGHVGDESLGSIRNAEEDIKFFLERFSDDSRAGKIREYQREIDLDDLEKKIGKAENPTALERAYGEALGYASSDPEKCIVKLQAVIDLYSSGSKASGPAGLCIELARRHLQQVKQDLKARAEDQLPPIEARLGRADDLKADDPPRAEAMYRAVIELYSADGWAAPAVQRAKAALDSMGKDATMKRKVTTEAEESPPPEEN